MVKKKYQNLKETVARRNHLYYHIESNVLVRCFGRFEKKRRNCKTNILFEYKCMPNGL